MNDIALHLENVVSGYKKPLHKPVSLSIKRHQLIGIAGPNGTGKSTLLKSILGFIPLYSGKMNWNPGSTSKNLSPKISYLPQEPQINELIPLLGYDLIKMAKPKYFSEKKDIAAKELLQKLEIEKLLEKNFHQLSGGEKQRLLIARSLTLETDFLVWDEPENHLDGNRFAFIENFLEKIKEKRSHTLLCSSHQLINRQHHLFDTIIDLQSN